MKRSVAYYQTNRPLRIFSLLLRAAQASLFPGYVLRPHHLLDRPGLSLPLRSALNTLLPNRAYHAFFLVILFFAVAYVCKGLLYFVVSYWGACLWGAGGSRFAAGSLRTHGEPEF